MNAHQAKPPLSKEEQERLEWELFGSPWPAPEPRLKRLANRIKPLFQVAGNQIKRLVGHAR